MPGRRNAVSSVIPKDVLENLDNSSVKKFISKYACYGCHSLLPDGNPKKGYCKTCLEDKNLFPVNYKRQPEKKRDDDDD
jgi:rRNA maturation endonuclease Nob1